MLPCEQRGRRELKMFRGGDLVLHANYAKTSLARSLPLYSLRRIKERIPHLSARARPSANDTPVIIPPIGQTTNLINPLPSRRRRNDFPETLGCSLLCKWHSHSHPDLQVMDGVAFFGGTPFPNTYVFDSIGHMATSRSLEL